MIDFLSEYKYLAMFGILFLCGVGLPVPEELTLVGSGLLVGWKEASLPQSILVCITGILAGDSLIFGLGHFYGARFLGSRPMRLLISPRRQRKVRKFFQKHGNKTIFLARFFTGVRMGVYAYSGSQGMSWSRFLFLDFLGTLISVPMSILVGRWAAQNFADSPKEAQARALKIMQGAGHWLVGSILAATILYLTLVYFRRRRCERKKTAL